MCIFFFFKIVCKSTKIKLLIIKETLANHGMTHDAKMERCVSGKLKTPLFYKMCKFCDNHTLASMTVRES